MNEASLRRHFLYRGDQWGSDTVAAPFGLLGQVRPADLALDTWRLTMDSAGLGSCEDRFEDVGVKSGEVLGLALDQDHHAFCSG